MFLKRYIEEFFPDSFDLVCKLIFCLWWQFPGCSILCLESLGEDILLHLDNLHDFTLQHLEAFSKVSILLTHTFETQLLVLRNHQVEVRVSGDFTELKFGVRLCWSQELAIRVELLTTGFLLAKHPGLHCLLEF